MGEQAAAHEQLVPALLSGDSVGSGLDDNDERRRARHSMALRPLAIGLTLAILVVGFIYEWKKGALEWE